MEQLPYNSSRNRVIDRINAFNVTAGSGLNISNHVLSFTPTEPGRLFLRTGRVTNTGPVGSESDFPDYRYWVRLLDNHTAYASGDTSNSILNLVNSPDVTSPVAGTQHDTIIAYSLTEYDAGSHGLSLNTVVEMLPVYFDVSTDSISIPQVRWVIVGGGGTSSSGQFMYQENVMVAQNSPGWRQDRYSPNIPNS